ncbi:MAG TPA: hypothetical protein VNW29_01060 [Candidatus Sulfotelmatobacter sp.]|nr:hypothetical protein [Candidatus Sulfotelmatobacter sp.]
MASETELLMQAEFQAGNETMYWNKMANDKNSDITKQLLGVTALLIPLTSSIVLTLGSLNDALKVLVGGSLIFFFISMIFGVIDIFLAARFFREYTNFNASRSSNYHQKRNETLQSAEKENEKLKPPPMYSSTLPQVFQIASLGVGILLIIGIAITLLILHK